MTPITIPRLLAAGFIRQLYGPVFVKRGVHVALQGTGEWYVSIGGEKRTAGNMEAVEELVAREGRD